MNYREMLDKLRRGELSADEAALLEEEIERHEAIDEYLAEKPGGGIWDEEESEPEDAVIEAIGKNVKKRFRRVGFAVFAALMLCAALCAAGYFAIREYGQASNYDPNEGLSAAGAASAAGQFYVDMRTYLELFCPGYALQSAQAISEGAGMYSLNATVSDIFTWQSETWTDTLSRGELKSGYDGLWKYPIGNAFGYREGWIRSEGHYGDADQRQYYLEELSRLPETTRAAAYCTFEEALTLEELKALMDGNPGLVVSYAAVKTNDDYRSLSGNTMGFNPHGMFLVLEEESVPDTERYPCYDLHMYYGELQENPAPIWEEHFKSLLKYLRDSDEFREAMTPLWTVGNFEIFEEELQYLEKNGVMIYGVYATGQAEDILALEAAGNIFSFYVDNVMFSSLARNR